MGKITDEALRNDHSEIFSVTDCGERKQWQVIRTTEVTSSRCREATKVNGLGI